MPRRDAPISRQQQAFEMLLDQQYASHPVSANKKGDRQSNKSNRTVSDKRGSGKVPGFALREPLPGQQAPQQSSAQVEQLYSMFGSSLERSTIEHVFLQCKHSVDATIDELLALSEQKQSEATASSSSAQPAQPSGTHQQTPPCCPASQNQPPCIVSSRYHGQRHLNPIGGFIHCLLLWLQALMPVLVFGVGSQRSARPWC